MGATAVVEDWQLRVNSSVPNADAEVEARNTINGLPKPGYQFFLYNITITYIGNGSMSTFDLMLDLGLVGAADVAYPVGANTWCGVVPDDLRFDLATELFSDGSLTGNDCRAIQSSDASSVLLYWQSVVGNQQVFFRLS